MKKQVPKLQKELKESQEQLLQSKKEVEKLQLLLDESQEILRQPKR
ncbi:hypothetical protein QUG02_00165 [Bacillus hominis]|uniref:Uncharacterized protein n=1 Tax=Bacillus hominis TaxID=2817478 RepID=A0ABT7R171_9BACI|nr:hypothetical protein [Bacillus hominis]